ncbi:MAG: primosomal protein N', partial [Xanthobacteraceae bacterium]|nr:primosomal protein N' [Xanthobacteraceae bacterium]
AREEAGLPPFGRMVAVIVSAKDGPSAEAHARRLAAHAPISDDVRLLGPAEAPLSMIRGRHRWRLLVSSPRNFDLSYYVREWLAATPPAKGSVRVQIDVDPQSFL